MVEQNQNTQHTERKINYSIHCTYKHISGVTKGIKEFISKVNRVYVKLLNEDNLSEEDEAFIKKILQELHNILVEMQDISWDIYKMEIGLEKSSIDIWAIISGIITTYRTKIEELLADWLRFMKSKGYKEEDLGVHFIELHEVLGDLYKIEQDHIPELLTQKRSDKESAKKD